MVDDLRVWRDASFHFEGKVDVLHVVVLNGGLDLSALALVREELLVQELHGVSLLRVRNGLEGLRGVVEAATLTDKSI